MAGVGVKDLRGGGDILDRAMNELDGRAATFGIAGFHYMLRSLRVMQ